MGAFWDWFIGEAGAAWILGILGLIGIIYTWLRRERPAHIIVQGTQRVRLLDIQKTQLERLTVLYASSAEDRHSVRSLEQVALVVYNNGTSNVDEPIEVALELSRESPKTGGETESTLGFWALTTGANDNDIALTHDKDDADIGVVTLKLPYLNSFPLHGQYHRLYLVSEHPLNIRLRQGMGKGWSARAVSHEEFSKLMRKWARIIQRVLLGISVIGLFGMLVSLLRSPLIRVGFILIEDDLNYLIEYFEKMRDLVRVSGPFVAWRPDVFLLGLERMGGILAVYVYGITLLAAFLMQYSSRMARFLVRQYLRIQPDSRFTADGEQAEGLHVS